MKFKCGANKVGGERCGQDIDVPDVTDGARVKCSVSKCGAEYTVQVSKDKPPRLVPAPVAA